MGDLESKIQADKYADWQSHDPCACGTQYLVITLMKHKSVPLTNKARMIGTNGARAATFGLSDAFHFKAQSFTHDCIQFSIMCSTCASQCCCTLDYSNDPTKPKKRFGKYCRTYDGGYFDVPTYRPKKILTMRELNRIYQKEFDWKAEKYVLAHVDSNKIKNCKTYANYIFKFVSDNY